MQLQDSKSKISDKLLLFFILLVTFVLSLKQMYPFESLDEAIIMNWIKDLDRNPFPVLRYPSLFVYFHYVLTWIYKAVLSFLGIINNTSDFLISDFGFRFTIEAGRVVSALFGTLTVFFAYKIGETFYNKHTGFAAAVLMGANNLLVLYSHVFKPDILVTLLVTVTLYFVLKYFHQPEPKYIFLASLFYGLAVAAKFNAFPIIAAIILTVLFARKRDNRIPVIKTFLLLSAGAAAGFFAGAPNWLIHPLGNLKQLFTEFSPGSGQGYETYDLKTPLETYQAMSSDFITYFGLIFFVFLIAAVLTGLFIDNKKDILISSFIVVYVIFFGFFGFYAGRFGLPLYPAAALLIGKFLFLDLKKLFLHLRQYKRLWQYVVPVLCIPIAIYVLHNTIINVKSFNLLKTQSEWDRTLEYRKQHNIEDKHFNIGRQIFTPRVKGKNIKLTKKFYLKFSERDSRKLLHFVQAHLPTYNTFMAAIEKDKKKKDPRAVNLLFHKPFYWIRKREYQPWNPECIFLYHISPSLWGIKTGQYKIDFPRPFYRSKDTSFLPLQIYEKNPNFGKLSGGIYKHWLYSTKEIKKLKIFLFSRQKDFDVTVRINNTTLAFKKELRERLPVEVFEIHNIKYKKFYYDYVYHMEIESKQEQLRGKPYYFVFYPVYADDADESGHKKTNKKEPIFVLNKKPIKEIPRLFSNERIPPWMKSVYKKTGVDLALLNFLSNHILYKNSHKIARDISIDYIPLERGHYFLRLYGEKIVDSYPVGSTAFLEYTLFSSKGMRKQHVGLKGQLLSAISLEVKERIGFVKIDIKGLRKNNYSLKRVAVVPDYRQFFLGNPEHK